MSPCDLTGGLLGQMRSRTGTYFSVNCLGKATKEGKKLLTDFFNKYFKAYDFAQLKRDVRIHP